MARRLLITRKELTNVNYQALGAFRLRVEVSDPSNSGADPYVFLYNQRPINPYNSDVAADFMAITSPGDLAEYPIGEPRDGTAYPFFRLDYVELDFRASSQAQETYLLILAEIDALLRTLSRLDELVPVNTTWVGDPLEEGTSDSASSSTSN